MTPKRSTTARGYRHRHQVLGKQWKRVVDAGAAVCAVWPAMVVGHPHGRLEWDGRPSWLGNRIGADRPVSIAPRVGRQSLLAEAPSELISNM